MKVYFRRDSRTLEFRDTNGLGMILTYENLVAAMTYYKRKVKELEDLDQAEARFKRDLDGVELKSG